MNELTLKDKLFVFSAVVGLVVSNYMGNGMAILSSYATLGLWLSHKVFTALGELNLRLKDIEKREKALNQALLPEELATSNHTYDAPSISRLLSAVKVDNDTTLFDKVVESSTGDDLSLRLTRTANLMLESLNSIDLDNGSRIKNQTTKKEV